MSFIAFHGTNLRGALGISRHGFKLGTYFARHAEDALEFGGSIVFHVTFEEWEDDRDADDQWQWREPEVVPFDRVVRIEWRPLILSYTNRELEDELCTEAVAARRGAVTEADASSEEPSK